MAEKGITETKQKKTYTEIHKTSSLAFDEFLKEFKNEGDRASVILGAARIDLSLYHLLQYTLLPNTGKTDDLLEGDSPLSSFSARINICYRLGLITAETTRALHLIRKIRNIFAHETSGSMLDSGSHRDRVRELVSPFLTSTKYLEFRDKFFQTFEGASKDFRAVVTLLVLRLDGGVSYIPSFKSNNPISLMPPDFSKPEDLSEENTEE